MPEPYGYLTDTYSPLNYHVHISYDPSAQHGVAAGLPTSVQGDSITQSIDAATPTRTPTQTFSYDGFGNLTAYNKGGGTWQLSYDSLNRPTSVRDPDSYTSYSYYYDNGQLSKSETPYQHGTSTGTTYSYDADGNETSETVYHGGTYNDSGSLPTLPPSSSKTIKWYDGADRLVEVQQPRDSSGTGEAYTNPWTTRYVYDLSESHTFGPVPSVGSQSNIWAHGNLFKTEELDPQSDTVIFSNTASTATNSAFHDLKGAAFDSLDRQTVGYYFVINSAQSADNLQQETSTYDSTVLGSNNVGALSTDCNGLNQCTNYAYDADWNPLQTSNSADTSLDRTLAYDPNGRAISVLRPTLGTWTYSYDGDGRLAQSVEPSGMQSAATLTNHYYADGMRSSLDVASANLNQSGIFAYAYRTDSKIETQQINLPSNSLVGTTTLNMSYSAAGRLQNRSESGPGANATPTQFAYNATYGYLSEIDSPAGKETNLQYDPSGSLLGQIAAPNSINTTYESTFSYTMRGELRTSTQPTSFNQPSPAVNIMANGLAVNTNYTQPRKTVASWQNGVDARMGAVLGTQVTYTDGSDSGQSIKFDALGRVIEDDAGSDPAPSCDTCRSTSTVTTRSYDQDDHVLTTAMSGIPSGPANATYTWGANGHPVMIGGACTTNVSGCPTAGTMGYETLHWDGDQLLFTTRGNLVDDIKVGALGDVTPQDSSYSGLTFWDRDPSGTVVYCHNATGGGGNGKPSYSYSIGIVGRQAVTNPCVGLSTSPASMLWSSATGYVSTGTTTTMIGWGGVLAMPRSDGLVDGFNQIQGGRIFDSTLNGWATPDAYQGQVHDPMSQKSYIWNRSNGISYSDPSGYLSTAQQNSISRYLAFHPPGHVPIPMDCTTYILHTMQNALGIDLNAAIMADTGGGNVVTAINEGYRVWTWTGLGGGFRHGTPAQDAFNLYHYFSRMGELHPLNLSGYGLQVGDIVFGIDSNGNPDHVAMVSKVVNGYATEVLESTGKTQQGAGTQTKPWDTFTRDALDGGMWLGQFARIRSQLGDAYSDGQETGGEISTSGTTIVGGYDDSRPL